MYDYDQKIKVVNDGETVHEGSAQEFLNDNDNDPEVIEQVNKALDNGYNYSYVYPSGDWEIYRMDIEKTELSINFLSDDMIKCAKEKGYKLPVVSIKHLYGKPAKFTHWFKPERFELEVFSHDETKTECIYLIS